MELINLKLKLESKFNSIPPIIDVTVNDHVYFNGAIVEPEFEIDINHQCTFGEKYYVRIARKGKTNDCPEQLLKIVGLEIDGTNVRDIMWHTSLFYPQYPEPWATEQKEKEIELEYPVYGETILGHNGIWEFEFSSPFYQYLINKVRF